MLRREVWGLGVMVILSGCGGTSVSSDSSAVSSSDTSEVITDNYGREIPTLSAEVIGEYLDVINKARASEQDCGEYGVFEPAPALSWSDALYKASYEHTQDLVESNTMSHNGSGTESDWTAMDILNGTPSSMKERIERYGYVYYSIGENITAGTERDTAQEAIDSWLASDGHCANLMSTKYTEVGMSYLMGEDTNYTHYWTQNFGKPQ